MGLITWACAHTTPSTIEGHLTFCYIRCELCPREKKRRVNIQSVPLVKEA